MPITDIVFLEDHSWSQVLVQEEPYSIGRWYEANNIDLIVLSLLGEMLGAGTYDELMEQFELLGEPSEDGAVLLLFPHALRQKISTLSDEELEDVLPKWAIVEEFGGAADIEELRKYLSGLREFLASAGDPAYLFLSP